MTKRNSKGGTTAWESLKRILKMVPGLGWWALPFLATEVALASYGFSTFRLPFAPLVYADPLRPFLIGADLTIAVFAVNFSLLSVQLSVYRNALQRLSIRLTPSAVITLLIALAPVVAAAFSEKWTATVAVLALPVLTYMAVLLTVITQSHLSANRYIKKLCREDELNEFIRVFSEAAAAIDIDPPELVVSDGTPPPVHEMGWQIYPVTVEPDPLNELSVIAALAAEAGDLATYVEAVNATLKLANHIHQQSFSRGVEDLAGSDLLRQHCADSLSRISRLQPSWDTTGILAHRFIHACAAFLFETDLSAFPRSSLALTIVCAMAGAAKALIESGVERQAIDVVVVARRVALIGSKTNPREPLTDAQHRHTLAGHARIMQELGETAIANSNAHLLFRCLDGLRFLGCSAAKVNNTELGTACLLGLVQLGRMARKEELPCFWDRCSLTPEDHAEEGIGWILTWIPKLDEKGRERWGASIADALSRLRGFETTVSFTEQNGSWQPKVTYSEAPYIYRINDNGRWRSYDFSDQNVLRELVIY
jgi:hypothetical protein